MMRETVEERGCHLGIYKTLGHSPKARLVITMIEVRSYSWLKSWLSIIHPARRERRSFFLGELGDRRLGGDDQPCDRCGILQCGAHDLGRVDDPERNEVAIFVGLSIKAIAILIGFDELADHHTAVAAGVIDDLACGSLDRLTDDLNSGFLIGVLDLDAF